ncbi:MAG: ImmA/IrrE family metallo-endopeptidase [Pedobacter sp.]|nr:ImmA/IrrE family metallo-endopeptidase [Pedobacter sp.]
MNKLVIEKKAAEFRNTHGIGTNDCIRLKSLLSKLNVLTVFKPLHDNFSGMAIKVESDVPKRFILVNSSKSLGNQHFTICHELYHLFIQEKFHSMVCTTGLFKKEDKEEYFADLFAAYLLIPETGIKALIPDDELIKNRITVKTILKIEHYFSCSRSALLYRLKDLDIIDNNHYDNYCQNVKRSALEQGYEIDLYSPGNHNLVVGDYGSIARELFEQEKISESNYFSLLIDLGMNVDELEKLDDGRE